jgi:formate transporter
MERQQQPQKKPGGYTGHSSGPRHRGPRHQSGNLIAEIYSASSRRLGRVSNVELFLLAILGGAFMCAATLASIHLTGDFVSGGSQYLLTALALSAGLLLVVITKSALFTEANIYVSSNFYNLTIMDSCLRLFRFWLIVWIGNFLGALIFAYLVYLSQDYSEGFRQALSNMTMTKLTNAGQLKGTGELIISGMLANWLIALVTFFAVASRNLVNQFILVFLVFILTFTTNFQYFPINLSYAVLDTFLAGKIGLFNAIFYNLIPVSLGNVLGAALLVSAPLLFLSKKR